jgi:hypothetical protein
VSDAKRSFWSSIPGLITGLAGLLTGVVGLITLLVQQGIIGHDSGAKTPPNAATSTTVTSTVAGGTSGSATSTTAEAGTFTVLPTAIDFPPTDLKPKNLTVKNTSASASLTVKQPTVVGTDADKFSVSMGTCASRLAANLTCTMQVTFTPPAGSGLKMYRATLQLMADGAPRGNEVALTASTLL